MFKAVEVLFLLSGGLTLAYMLKLFVAIFIEKGDYETAEKKSSMTMMSGIAVCGSAVLLPVFGLTPNLIFAKIGHLAEEFFCPAELIPEEVHAIHWLSFENLKGALISVAIGVVVYVFVVRILLIKEENGRKVYVNRIPAWMDLEEFVYRLVVLHALPFILAFFSRICDTLVDGVTGLLRATVFAPRKRKMSIWVGTKVTHMLGTVMDGVVAVLNKTLFHNHPIKKSFVSVFAVSELEARQTFSLITGSVSFGLLLAAMGLAITLIYLLF
jgi:hydrogenase-4 component B